MDISGGDLGKKKKKPEKEKDSKCYDVLYILDRFFFSAYFSLAYWISSMHHLRVYSQVMYKLKTSVCCTKSVRSVLERVTAQLPNI